MAVCITDTRSRCKRPLRPLIPGRVQIYVCGPTVYDEPHVGHARSAVVFDVVRRFLQAQGLRVTLVRNITDIDDKIFEKARRWRQDVNVLGARYLRCYREAMHRLNVAAPDAEPKASEHIPLIQDFISRLIQKGNAYVVRGSVYFDVSSFRHYGQLSGRCVSGDKDDQRCHGTGKNDPADFALWKAAKPPDPVWPSPWGPGRPGWHIECSVMSTHLLGPVFDIHGGGSDLIFPHHENEIAQSQSLYESPPANIWMHHGLVHANGRKVSKSRGDYAALAQLLDSYPADALRLVLLSKRYRHPMDFSHRRMQSGLAAMTRIHGFFARLDPQMRNRERRPYGRSDRWSRFCDAMADDFNFPMALSIVFEAIRAIQRSIRLRPGAPRDNAQRSAVSELYTMCHEILGFDLKRF